MTPSRPIVSVLMPVRNGLPWLAHALDSLFHQTFTRFELIVLEDGSSDGTAALLKATADRRLRVITTGGIGIARTLNIGLGVARGRYVARHDADDESLPERLERQVAFLDAHPDIDVVATAAEYIDHQGHPALVAELDDRRRQDDRTTTPEAIRSLMPTACCITEGSIVARRDALRRVHGYHADVAPAEDYDLWLRLLRRHRLAKVPAALYRKRLHAGQSRTHEQRMAKEIVARERYRRYVERADHAVLRRTA